jgi:hypothetical protein
MIEQMVILRRPILDVFDYLMDFESFGGGPPQFLETTIIRKDNRDWPSRFRAQVGFTRCLTAAHWAGSFGSQARMLVGVNGHTIVIRYLNAQRRRGGL